MLNKDLINKVGGIIHEDGNILFANITQLQTLIDQVVKADRARMDEEAVLFLVEHHQDRVLVLANSDHKCWLIHTCVKSMFPDKQVAMFTGDTTEAARLAAIDGFDRGTIQLLITNSGMALGSGWLLPDHAHVVFSNMTPSPIEVQQARGMCTDSALVRNGHDLCNGLRPTNTSPTATQHT